MQGTQPQTDKSPTPQIMGEPPPGRILRLCFISNPNSVHTRRWVSWFARRGHTVCLLADVPLEEPWDGVQVIDLSKIFYTPVIRFPIWTMWLKGFLRQWHPDILHAHRVNSAGWLGAFSGFHPLVVTPWGSDVLIQPQHSPLARLLARYTLKQADLITVGSQDLAHHAVQLGARRESVHQIHNGVEMDIFSPTAPNAQKREEVLARLSMPENARLVFSPRAVNPIYNLDIILTAIPRVRQQIAEAYFIFTEFNVDMAYKGRLDQMIKEMSLEAYIRWIKPASDRSEMADWYRLSDVVVSVPSTDSAALTVLEAMACARPVVCSDLPAMREFIINGENGNLVPARQVAPLAEDIIQLLLQPEKASAVGRNAHQVVADQASYKVEMQRMENLYLQIG